VDLVSNRKIPIATPRCRVGRDDLNDIVISGDQSISRFHFIISFENGEFTVQDAKSRHGTFLNGNQLTVSEPIKDGDVLKVGVSLFWFVVEGAQTEATDPATPSSKVNAITADEKAAAEGANVTVKAASEMDATASPSDRSQEMTQEMTRPDPALMDKLEQAANSIKIEEKIEPRASLASLLADARANEAPEPDKKKEELAALAARDKEMLDHIDEPAAPAAEVAAPAEEVEAAPAAEAEPEAAPETKAEEPAGLKEEEFPIKPVNKPSDTVTLEALSPTMAANNKKTGKAKEEEAEEVPAAAELPSTEVAAATEPATEDFEPEPVSKQTDSKAESKLDLDTKAANAGIMDSSKETLEDTHEETQEVSRDAAETEAEAPAEIQISLSLPPGPGLGASLSMADTGNGAGSSKGRHDHAEESTQNEGGRTSKAHSEPQDQEFTKFIKAGASTVPDWCKRYFSDEIAKLNSELDELNEQVKIAQQKIRDVETRVALTRGIRNTLLTTTGDELVEACGKVLSLLGWKVTLTAEDKHELRLEVEDKHVCIARVIWTTTKAERSHLGQLSISQTRYWMEKGIEPKGIIIVSKISSEAPTSVGDSPEEVELNDYAAKRNVCLMSTLQLLSLYKEIALSDASPDKLRTSIVNASGWLAGHNLEPGSADIGEDEGASGQAAGKVSSLASA
jgi:pSer/pThr/pTyr-binding forkhead associated (FHA) protein